MWGAIIGDLAGSIYEFEQINEIKSVNTNQVIPDKGFFSDDTILTIAIAEAIQTDKNYESHLKKYIQHLLLLLYFTLEIICLKMKYLKN